MRSVKTTTKEGVHAPPLKPSNFFRGFFPLFVKSNRYLFAVTYGRVDPRGEQLAILHIGVGKIRYDMYLNKVSTYLYQPIIGTQPPKIDGELFTVRGEFDEGVYK